MTKHIISTANAPAAIGPYSQAVAGDHIVFVSGQLPIDPAVSAMPDTIEAQTRQSMKNVVAIVEAAGGCAASIAKCTLFVRDMKAFGKINEVYQTFFTAEPPARAVIEVSALPKDAMIEIEAIALL